MITKYILSKSILTYIEIPMENRGSVPKLVRFEVWLHISNLHISLVRFQLARIYRIRILYYDNILCAESLGIKVFEPRKYLREFRQGWLFVNELFTGEIAKSRAIKTNSEICPEDAFAGQLFHTRICLVKFSKQKSRKNILCSKFEIKRCVLRIILNNLKF